MHSESLIRQADTQDLESSLSGSNGFNKYGYNHLTIFFQFFNNIIYIFIHIFIYTDIKIKIQKMLRQYVTRQPFYRANNNSSSYLVSNDIMSRILKDIG